MYILQLDQNKNFQCQLKIEGASLKNSRVCIVVENDKFDFKFKGKIESDGTVIVPISKLKGILEENTKGKLYIEVVADDTYFIPYQTEYITEVSRKVEVLSVGEHKTPITETVVAESTKPTVTVTHIHEEKTFDAPHHAKRIIKKIQINKYSLFNIKHKKHIANIIQQYLTENQCTEQQTISIKTNLLSLVENIVN